MSLTHGCTGTYVARASGTDVQDILDRPDEEGEPQPQEGLEELSELMLDLVIRQAPKRRQFSIPLKFGGREGDIEIGVAGCTSSFMFG